MDEKLIKEKIAMRDKAKAIVAIIVEECPAGKDLVLQDTYWEEIRKALPLQPRPKSRLANLVALYLASI